MVLGLISQVFSAIHKANSSSKLTTVKHEAKLLRGVCFAAMLLQSDVYQWTCIILHWAYLKKNGFNMLCMSKSQFKQAQLQQTFLLITSHIYQIHILLRASFEKFGNNVSRQKQIFLYAKFGALSKCLLLLDLCVLM